MPRCSSPECRIRIVLGLICTLLPAASLSVGAQTGGGPLHTAALAEQNFGADAPWYLANIPFLEIDDPDIQKVYYYRWKLYRSHLREIGAQGTDETEFLDDVPWARHPFTDLNDSSAFHIMEGRWLRDPAYVTSLVDHLYSGGGNDRHFSEWIAAAVFEWSKVTGDPGPALRHLDAMQHIYNLWDDHFDARRNLYWVEPLLDATEYTISSIDASGAGFTDHPSLRDDENGFTGGFAFRPSINAYQFGNARAIANLARIAGNWAVAADYDRRAEALRRALQAQLWNPELEHFTDIYQRSTMYVKAGELIRGRELAGFVPWMFGIPVASSDGADYTTAWRHLLDGSQLAGPYGIRTVEPTYPRYLQQYRYDRSTGQPECQWNGPSWPFQTSETLTALASFLHAGPRNIVTTADYVHLLRQYTRQHLLPSGQPDLQEDYNPDTGASIVGLPRSHHYNHSTYNDLVLSGLIGIQPHADDTLELDPLLPAPDSSERTIRFFAVQGLRYHGHDIAILWDADGTHYRAGAGLSIFSDGRRLSGPTPLRRTIIQLPRKPLAVKQHKVDLAVNVWGRAPSIFEVDLPIASASSTAAGSNPYEAIDGRLWFFPEIPNGWSPAPSDKESWFAVDLRKPRRIDAAEIDFFSDGSHLSAPASHRVQMLSNGIWKDIPGQKRTPSLPLANGENEISFPVIEARQLRVLLPARDSSLRLVEFKVLAPSGPEALARP